jgi:hypothetical protein
VNAAQRLVEREERPVISNDASPHPEGQPHVFWANAAKVNPPAEEQ